MGERTGLRERKRLAAMRRIQRRALDLFDEHGYAQVTIERIAAAAEVSPSSVYRYFGTKEQVLLWDEFDPMVLTRMADLVRDQPPMAAARQAVTTVIAEMFADTEGEEYHRNRRRVRYMMEEPSVEAAATILAFQMGEQVNQVLADGLGRSRDDLEVYLFSYALVGAALGVIRHWYRTGFQATLPELLDRVFVTFERGFTFDGRPAGSADGPAGRSAG